MIAVMASSSSPSGPAGLPVNLMPPHSLPATGTARLARADPGDLATFLLAFLWDLADWPRSSLRGLKCPGGESAALVRNDLDYPRRGTGTWPYTACCTAQIADASASNLRR